MVVQAVSGVLPVPMRDLRSVNPARPLFFRCAQAARTLATIGPRCA
jgi:hypothetical protein